jgi:GxxExxY protein
MNDIDNLIINSARRVFNTIGIGHTERIYHKALVYELNCIGLNIDTEMNIIVKYEDSKGKIHNLESLRIDIFMHDYNIILELKAIQRKIQAQEIAQIKKYFNILCKEGKKIKYGYIINFPQPSTKEISLELEYLKVNNS